MNSLLIKRIKLFLQLLNKSQYYLSSLRTLNNYHEHLKMQETNAKVLKLLFLATIILVLSSLLNPYKIEFNNEDILFRLFYWNGIYNPFHVILIWASIYLYTKDKIASISGMILHSFEVLLNINEHSNLLFLLIPFCVFGFLHFRNMKGLYFSILPLILLALKLGTNSSIFENKLFWAIKYLGNFNFDFYPFSKIFTTIVYNLIPLISFILFNWLYKFCESEKNVINYIKKITLEVNDKFTFSITYWTLRIFLFVISLGIIEHIDLLLRLGFKYNNIILIVAFTVGLIISATIYRNLLVGTFVLSNKYPKTLYFLLNIPIINIFAWFYSLKHLFKLKQSGYLKDINITIDNLKKLYKDQGRNSVWRITILIGLLFMFCYHLETLGFRFGDPFRAISIDFPYSEFVILLLSISFLFIRVSYWPIILVYSISLILTMIMNQENIIYSFAAVSIINNIIYSGVFYFDTLIIDSKKDKEQ